MSFLETTIPATLPAATQYQDTHPSISDNESDTCQQDNEVKVQEDPFQRDCKLEVKEPVDYFNEEGEEGEEEEEEEEDYGTESEADTESDDVDSADDFKTEPTEWDSYLAILDQADKTDNSIELFSTLFEAYKYLVGSKAGYEICTKWKKILQNRLSAIKAISRLNLKGLELKSLSKAIVEFRTQLRDLEIAVSTTKTKYEKGRANATDWEWFCETKKLWESFNLSYEATDDDKLQLKLLDDILAETRKAMAATSDRGLKRQYKVELIKFQQKRAALVELRKQKQEQSKLYQRMQKAEEKKAREEVQVESRKRKQEQESKDKQEAVQSKRSKKATFNWACNKDYVYKFILAIPVEKYTPNFYNTLNSMFIPMEWIEEAIMKRTYDLEEDEVTLAIQTLRRCYSARGPQTLESIIEQYCSDSFGLVGPNGSGLYVATSSEEFFCRICREDHGANTKQWIKQVNDKVILTCSRDDSEPREEHRLGAVNAAPIKTGVAYMLDMVKQSRLPSGYEEFCTTNLIAHDEDESLLLRHTLGDAQLVFKYYGNTLKIIDDKGRGYQYDEKKRLWIEKSDKEICTFIVKFVEGKINHYEALVESRLTAETDSKIDYKGKPYQVPSLMYTSKKAKLANIKKELYKSTTSISSHLLYYFKDFGFKDMLDNTRGELPIADGKVINFRTKEVRIRTPEDLWTFERPISYKPETGSNAYSNVKKLFGEWSNYLKSDDALEEELAKKKQKEEMKEDDTKKKPRKFKIEIQEDAKEDLTDPNNPKVKNRKRAGFVLYHQRRCGYILTGEGTMKKFFIDYGLSNAGKSAWLELMQQILGVLYVNVAATVFREAAQNKGAATPDIIPLKKGRLCVTTDSDSKSVPLDSQFIKIITSGAKDGLSARGLYGETHQFIPRFSCVYLCNTQPTIDVYDSGMRSRIFQTPWDNEFKPNPDFMEDFYSNHLDEAFSWMVDGAAEYYTDKSLKQTDEVKQATESLINQNDLLSQFCLPEEGQVVLEESALIQKKKLWHLFDGWQRDKEGMKLKETTFYKEALERFGEQRIQNNRARCNFYEGIRSINDQEKQDHEALAQN